MLLQRTTIAICGLFAMSFVHGTPIGDCHCRDPLKQGYHVADDKDCTVFYKCVNATPVKLVCPEGLHFNRRLEVCDWPDAAGCPVTAVWPEVDSSTRIPCTSQTGDSVTSEYITTTGTSKSDTNTPEEPSTTLSDSLTSEYITTTDTSKSDLNTTEEHSTTLSDTEMTSGNCPAMGTCPQHEDEKSIVKHLPHAYNCSQFCKCHHGVPIKLDCPVGLHFNPIREICDWPQKSNCSSTFSASLSNGLSTVYTIVETDPTFTSATDSTSTEITSVEPSTTEPSTTEPSTTEPSTTEPSTTEPSTTEPSTTEPSTTEPSTTELSTTEPSTTGPSTTEPSTTEPSTTEPSTTEPWTTDPSTTEPWTTEPWTTEPSTTKATTTELTTTEVMTTELTTDTTSTTVTTVASESTVWPGTSTSSSTTSWPSDTTTIITTAATEGTTVLPGDENACSVIQSCPIYNQQSVVKHLPHPTNCSLYCRCNHGAAITERCPVGLHFNAKLEVCDWPSHANCK